MLAPLPPSCFPSVVSGNRLSRGLCCVCSRRHDTALRAAGCTTLLVLFSWNPVFSPRDAYRKRRVLYRGKNCVLCDNKMVTRRTTAATIGRSILATTAIPHYLEQQTTRTKSNRKSETTATALPHQLEQHNTNVTATTTTTTMTTTVCMLDPPLTRRRCIDTKRERFGGTEDACRVCCLERSAGGGLRNYRGNCLGVLY